MAALIHLEDHLHGLEIDPLIDVMTFQAVERTIASSLRERVQNTADTIDAGEVRAIATRRQAGHWASPNVIGTPEVPRKALHAAYDALMAAADFFALRNRHRPGFDFPDALTLYHAYEEELYRFDQLYRRFCEAADQAELKGWNLLKPLRELLEACYTHGYLPELALSWDRFVDPLRRGSGQAQGSAALLGHWRIDGIVGQQQFYDQHIRPRLAEAENRKAYVILSDAFRYEAAQELVHELAALVAYLINNLNANHIVITADHGFLFTETAPGEPEKSKLEQKPNGTVRARKRYLIDHQLPDHETVWHGNTATTAGAGGEMEFWIPKAANRFHFAGGARFVHGGATLQEVVVPVITVKHRKDKAGRGETQIKSVTVHVLGNSHKITTNRHRFELIQMEPVSEWIRPVTLKVTVTLNERRDVYEALLANLGVKGVEVGSSTVKKYEKLKDFMASGSFARGRDSINTYASMVFVGNINQPVDTLVKTSHLFAPFPEAMIDPAFFDRFHAYIPGWEIPKMRPELFTNQYDLIVDYLAEWMREMRKRNLSACPSREAAC